MPYIIAVATIAAITGTFYELVGTLAPHALTVANLPF